MKALFMTILRMLDENETVTEIIMYENSEFAKIKFKTESGTYAVSIVKDKDIDGNE